MTYEFVRGPYLLLETVEMLFRFVNGLSFRSSPVSQRKLANNSQEGTDMVRRLDQLQKIMDETCEGLNPDDPALQRFFRSAGSGEHREACLAKCLTYSFCTLRFADFQAHIDEIRTSWHRLQDSGAWIRSCGLFGVSFSYAPGSPGDLFEQIRALKLSSDFQMELYGTLRNFDTSLDELVELIQPVVSRLAQTIRCADWILDMMEDYWKHAPIAPLDFYAQATGQNIFHTAGDRTRVAISLMNCKAILVDMEKSPTNFAGHNFLYIGCDITTTSLYRDDDVALEDVTAGLKALADKHRLDILRRLSKERSYGHELAEVMDMDSGNMARTLVKLHNFGFLYQERETTKNYYRTDREAIRSFFRQVEDVLFS